MKIASQEDYEYAKNRFKALFHADSCATNYYESQILMKALDDYEAKQHIKIEENKTKNI